MFIHKGSSEISEKIHNALKLGEKNIVFEKGEYHFYPDEGTERESCISNHDNDGLKKVGIQIENVNDVTIDGGGSKFIFHGIMLPFGIENSKNIKLCNFSIDFPISPCVHSTVLNAEKDYCDIKLWDNTPYRMEGDVPLFSIDGGTEFTYTHALEFNSKLECIEYGTNDRDYFKERNAEELKQGVLRIKQPFDVLPKAGNYLIFGITKRFAPGFFINSSTDVTVEKITIYNCLGMGLLAQLSKNITIKSIKVTPSAGRFISAPADAVHFVECSGEVLVENCHFEKQMDDPLNCHGIYVQIEEIDEKIAYVKLRHHQALGLPIFSEGDKVEYINPENLLSFGNNTVKKAEMLDKSHIKVTFENVLSAKKGDYVENISHAPSLTVKNSYFGKNRARGLLITTRGKVVVENNVFERAGAAIRISGDANFWFESGCVRDVTIKNNTFIDTNANARWGNAVIDIAPQVMKESGAVHKNITVENNTFKTFDIPLLWARCAENIVFKNNKIIKTDTFLPKGLIKERVTLLNCSHAEIEV